MTSYYDLPPKEQWIRCQHWVHNAWDCESFYPGSGNNPLLFINAFKYVFDDFPAQEEDIMDCLYYDQQFKLGNKVIGLSVTLLPDYFPRE